MSMWGKYGFPTIDFLPSYLPMRGLYLALLERHHVVLSPIETEDWPNMLDTYTAQMVFIRFDTWMDQVASQFINHLKNDFSDLREIPMWSLRKLAEALREDLIEPTVGSLVGELYVPWAMQRYRMINLLLFARVNFEQQIAAGAEHSGKPDSPLGAIDAAMRNATVQTQYNGTVGRVVNSIWGPDHGWRPGSYCADVGMSGNLRAILPIGLEGASVHFLLLASSPDALAKHFDSFGTGVVNGLNHYVTAALEWSLPGTPDKVFTPSEGKSILYGFNAMACCYANYAAMFQFIDEVNNAGN